jgi:hypothetical protein
MSLLSGDGLSIGSIPTISFQLVAFSFSKDIRLSPGQTMQARHFLSQPFVPKDRTVGTVCQWRPAFLAHLIGIEGSYRNHWAMRIFN